jgi:hypothetical protein
VFSIPRRIDVRDKKSGNQNKGRGEKPDILESEIRLSSIINTVVNDHKDNKESLGHV